RMSRRINAAGLELIKSFEGLRLQAYRDSVGIWTIGYGHTAGVKAGQTITEVQASQFLLADLSDAEGAVEKFVTVPLNDNQFAALVSLTFNIGAEAFRRSTLRKKLNAGDYAAVPGQLTLWVKGAGKTIPGLVRRRKAESDLWNTPSIAASATQKPVQPPPPVPAPEPQPDLGPAPAPAPAGKKGTAIGAGLVLAFAAAFWTTVADGWQHVIDFLNHLWSLF
ncbi:MAG TPA: lysozyme, partial [Rhizobiaceae bacterium]|nr:lysozyme [Rhizobiaceae bacterium]